MALAPAPVLLVTGMRDVRPRRLLVALAGTDADVRLLRWTRDLAVRFDAAVLALHVGLRPLSAVLRPVAALAGHHAEHAAPTGGYDASAPHDRLARLVSDGLAGLRASAEVVGGEASTAILDAAERHGSELIVIGRQDERRLRRALLGSVARRVLHGARCPVLVVVEPADELAEEGNGPH